MAAASAPRSAAAAAEAALTVRNVAALLRTQWAPAAEGAALGHGDAA